MPSKKLKIIVMVSGSGTNLQAMIDKIAAGELEAEIKLVVSNNPEAYGLTRARQCGLPTAVVDYSKYRRRRLPEISADLLPIDISELVERQEIYGGLPLSEVEDRLARLVLAEREIISLVEPIEPDLVCLAGYMRLLSPYFIQKFNRAGAYGIMNIHPALLPAFPGEHGYEDTFNYGCRFGGITVHYVDEGEDTGPVIAQAVYPIWPDDTLEDIKRRGLALEYQLYSKCIQWHAREELEVGLTAGGRPQVRILDPEYPQFVHELIEQAMQR
ncbi:MAG: phosphoribosylglycinamide formyltransferase [Deltaproteobacteria bacterium]|nr:phosphoribosylglycinamide formyltransferase [Deltaproteobacteria bacterium]